MGSEEYGASQATTSHSPSFPHAPGSIPLFSPLKSAGESSARERKNGRRHRDKA